MKISRTLVRKTFGVGIERRLLLRRAFQQQLNVFQGETVLHLAQIVSGSGFGASVAPERDPNSIIDRGANAGLGRGSVGLPCKKDKARCQRHQGSETNNILKHWTSLGNPRAHTRLSPGVYYGCKINGQGARACSKSYHARQVLA